MGKVRVPVLGTVGKSVLIDDSLGSRVAALERALAAIGETGGASHSSLSGLKIGDDHPQYTAWQGKETIIALWNFATIPSIGGVTLPEYIQDTIGDPTFMVDTASVDWTYNDGANTLSANVIPEFVQDVTGAMATDSTSIDFTYDDGAGTLTADVVYANPSGLIGMAAANGTSTFSTRSDARHAIDPAIAPEWTATHGWADSAEIQMGAGNDLRFFHDGTDSWVRNDTGTLKLSAGAASIFEVTAARGTFNVPARLKGYTVATLPAGAVGDSAYVTDALAPVFLGAVAGGGAVTCTVFYNGAAWVVQ